MQNDYNNVIICKLLIWFINPCYILYVGEKTMEANKTGGYFTSKRDFI